MFKKSSKVIADPLYGIIDIRPVLPMVETREFQALGDKRQLGMGSLVFPSATHTRKAHSIGAYYATRDLADRWIKHGFINSREADALAGYALYHDIGHPAFSHVTEPLCELPREIKDDAVMKTMSVNAAVSLAIIKRSRKVIAACGIDFNLMESMASHRNPLYSAVSDKNLGTEKLDYLERDGLYTILSRPVGVDYLRHHIYFMDGKIAIDEKVVDNAIEIQNYYLKIYKNVYLRKTSAIAQRMFQKMTHHLITAGEITRTDLIDLTDSELIGIMHVSNDPIVKTLYGLYRSRNLFREAIVIRPEKFARTETAAGKHVAIFGVAQKKIERIAEDKSFRPENQQGLEKLEAEIAAISGISPENILIVPIHGTERFEGQDISIYEGPGKKLASLKARYPAHFKNIEEVAQTHLAFRICTTEQHRKRLAEPKISKKVFELVVGM
jgi:HD superfamily phosphohydrolase